jgi:serine/threonine protein kinase/tetratricopeptide (TPR) repeat protein
MKPGDTVGSYQVLAKLGEGGMGDVYLANDTRLRRPVAIKILRGGPTDDSRMRLLREARAAAALNHPNICAVFDVAEFEGLDFAVFEFIEGRTLSEAIPPDGLPLEQVLRYGEGIAGGLAHAHERGIVHRDLKSGNVMIDSDGRLRILDFGIARRLEAGSRGDVATTVGDRSTVSGTLAYMSPEALRGEPLDARTDIWSLGIVLFEMVAGGRPFAGSQTFELTASILKDPAPRLPGRVPAGLRSVVSRCLAKGRTDRYQRASEVRAVLEALQAGVRAQRSRRQDVTPPAAGRTPDSRGGALTPTPPGAEAARRSGPDGGPAPEQASIVIVPFENLSPDPEHAFFADGLTEEIITDLSKVRALRVISRTSAALLRGCQKDAPAIARQMNVRYVLEGTVRRAGRELRITTKLIDAGTDSAIWAEKYAGSLDDVFDIQEKVSQAVVDALKVTLTPEERRRIADRPVANPAAFDCYLRARHEMWRFDEASIGRAIEWTQQALEIVGENDLLYATLGMAYCGYARAGIRPAASLEEAEACAARLDALGSRSPAACLLRAKINGHSHSLQAAVRDLKVVLDQDPNHAEALLELAYAYLSAGRVPAARPILARLLRVDPLTTVNHSLAGWADAIELRFEEALEHYRTAWQMAPDNPLCRFLYGYALGVAGRRDDCLAVFDQLASDWPATTTGRMALLLATAIRGDEARAVDVARTLEEAARFEDFFAHRLAEGYALVGRKDDALRWLEHAHSIGSSHHQMLSASWLLAAIHDDPRFANLMGRMKQYSERFEV